jgi:hypothetical protein
MTTIDTDNLVSDFIANTAAIFEDNMRTLGLKEIYDEDVLLVPTVPSLALSCISFWNTLRTISSSNVRYQFDFIGDFWYYDAAVSEDIKRNLIMERAYRIARHIIEHASLNGFLTNTRAEVKSCIYAPRLRSGILMASARIVVVAPYQFRVSSID